MAERGVAASTRAIAGRARTTSVAPRVGMLLRMAGSPADRDGAIWAVRPARARRCGQAADRCDGSKLNQIRVSETPAAGAMPGQRARRKASSAAGDGAGLLLRRGRPPARARRGHGV